MKTRYICFFLFFLFKINFITAQYQNYTISSPDSDTKTYIGRDYVYFLPGYSFKADTDKRMNALIKNEVSSSELSSYLGIDSYEQEIAIDQTAEVGEIPIQSSISLTGAKCYIIPIGIPSGREGFQPKIFFSYSSQMGNGPLGIGWSIGGLSAINRENENYFFSGKVESIKMDIYDSFSIDGIRLHKTNITDEQIEYRSFQGNIKAIAYIHTINILFLKFKRLKYFKVFYPNGLEATFGFDNNTKDNLSYPLSKLEDMNGNVIIYSYNLDNTEGNEYYYIDEINYGQKNNKSFFSKIKFSYTDRSDKKLIYKGTKSKIVRKKLNKIESFNGDELLRTYELSYSNKDYWTNDNNDVSKLIKIDCISNNQKLNPVKINYDNKNCNIEKETTTLLDADFKISDMNVLKGKFDTDLQNDALIIYPKKDNYNSNDKIRIFNNLDMSQSSPYTLMTGEGFKEVFFSDIDNKIGDEIIKINTVVENSTEKLSFKLYRSISNEIELIGEYILNTNSAYSRRPEITGNPHGGGGDYIYTYFASPRKYYIGNFTGEGKSQLLILSKKAKSSNSFYDTKNYLVSWDNNLNIEIKELSTELAFTNDLLFAMDIDGDTQTELVHITEDKTNLYKYNNQNGLIKIGEWNELSEDDFKTSVFTYNYSGSASVKRDSVVMNNVIFADINGDSYIDFIKLPAQIQYRYKYTNYPVTCVKCLVCGALFLKNIPPRCCSFCGTTESSQEGWCIYEGPEHYTPQSGGWLLPTHTKELNSENKCPVHGDFVNTEYTYLPRYIDFGNFGYGIKTPNIWTYYFTNGLGIKEKKEVASFRLSWDNKVNILDLDGDGQSELIIDSKIYAYNNEKNIFDRAVNMGQVSLNGKLIALNINKSDKFSNFACVRTTTINNHNCIDKYYYTSQEVRNFVSSITNSYGIVEKTEYKQLSSANYTYGNQAIFPYADFSGLLWVVDQNNIIYENKVVCNFSYRYKEAVFHKQGLGFCGFKSIQTIDLFNNNTAITEYDPYHLGIITKTSNHKEEIKYTYDHTFSPAIAKSLMAKQIGFDKLNGNTIITDYSNFDKYDNPQNIKIDYGGGTYSVITNKYKSVDETNKYITNLLTEQSIQRFRNGNSVTLKTTINYNDYKPISKTEFYNNNQTYQETYAYNSFGLLSNLTQRNYTSNNLLQTSYEYDDHGRLSKLSTPLDSEELYKKYTYNNRGLVSSTEDHRGNITIFEYDNFGHDKKQIYPDGTTSEIAYYWDSSANGSLYYILNTTSGQPNVKTYYDGLSREVRTAQTRFDGTELKVDKEYSSYGHLSKNSLPFKSSSSQWNEYEYDQFDRPIKIKYASGKEDTWSYQANSISVVQDGIQSTKNYDASGALLSVEDQGGTITYTLRADGQLTNITAPGDIITRFEYDKYGRQIKINDPSAGIQTYGYDAAGNINYQKDANGKTTTLTHDNYNRLIKKTYPEFYTTYTYNTYGELTSEISSNNTSHVFIYDNLGRVQVEKEIISDDKWLQKTFAYASNGNVESTGYKSQSGNIATENYYYQNGHLKEIKLNGQTAIWSLTEENSMGMPVKVNTGNIIREYGFDTYGFPTSRMAKISGSKFFHHKYGFDEMTGNLNYRTDEINRTMENFSYDGMNRLIGITSTPDSSPKTEQNIRYFPNGNIDEITGIGLFNYNRTDKPYALTDISAATGNEPMLSIENQTVEYTSFNRPQRIVQGDYTTYFTYNTNGDRVKTHHTHVDGGDLSERYYIGKQYEVDYHKEWLYLGGDAYSAPAVYVKESGSWNIYYICRDYLGSICAIANSSGSVVEKNSYDAWGRLRNSRTLEIYDQPQTLFLNRGFTGHEHLRAYGLINMNARLYDPVVGRFLSPDPYIQFPDFTQNFNRYSYVLNNPLKYTDESGELVGWILAGTIMLAKIYYDGYKANNKEHNPSNWDWENANYGFSIGNTGGDWSVSAGVGWNNNYINFGYAQDKGFGFGYGEQGIGSITYPFYQSKNPEQAVLGAEKSAWWSWDEFWGAVPVYGSSRRAGYALEQGDWLGTISNFGFGLFEMFTLGIGTELTTSYRAGNTIVRGVESTIGKGAGNATKGGTNVVYRGVDAASKTRYVGITNRDPAIRFAEHATSGTLKAPLRYEVIKGAEGLTRTQARVWEQTLINQHGLGRNGGMLYNQINSIAPKYWWQYGITY